MKHFILKRITIEDWRGQNREVVFTSKNVSIKGKNEIGKSTIFNAFLWVMTGSDELDRVNYQLFDNRVEQTYENSKTAKVEVVFDVDCMEYKLAKTAQMGWTRKRGHSEYERKGTDNYKFYIDDVERNATEYKKFIEGIAPMDHLKLMLNILYYQHLDWKALRKNFEVLVGEIKDEDFKGVYSSISDLLLKFDKDTAAMKDSLRPKLKMLRDNVGTDSKVGSLVVAIDTIKNNLPDISSLDEVESQINETKKQIEKIDKAIANDASNRKEQIEKSQQIAERIASMSNDLYSKGNEYNKIHSDKVHEVERKICDVRNQNYSIKRENDLSKENLMELKEKAQNIKYIISNCEKRHNELTKENNDCKAMKFDGGNCPYCGQPLPQDKLEEAIEQFNKKKEDIHLNIVSEGKHNREIWNTSLKRLEEVKSDIDNFKKPKELLSTSDLDKELADLKASFIPYEQTKEYLDKKLEIDQLKAEMTEAQSNDNSTLLETKKELIREIEYNSKKLGARDVYQKQMNEVSDLQNQLKESSKELALLEGKMAKVEEYERERASIISFKVNKLFDYISVDMTTTDKKGDIVDTCLIKDKSGTITQVTNTASQILCGIDISLAFQKFYNVDMVMFLDNCERVNRDNLPDIDNQLIKMYVTEDKTLKIEEE